MKNLLTKASNNYKLSKNNLRTYSLNLLPADTFKGVNVCPWATINCKRDCVAFGGRGKFANVYKSREEKTRLYAFDRSSFYIKLANELLQLQTFAERKGEKIAVRLNCYSDLPHFELLEKFTGVDFLKLSNLCFYDYTKSVKKAYKYLNTNYKLVLSRSEVNESDCLEFLKIGGSVAVVFDELPEHWHGFKVIDGDATDLRYFDPVNVVVGLRAKGKAKKDISAFVVRN